MIDTHAHLTDSEFADRDEIISNLKENKIDKVFTVAYSKQSIKDVFELSQKFDNVYAIIGIHPEEVKDYDNETIELLKEYSRNPKVVGIGEIGLDYHYENCDKLKQKEVFINQIKLAHELGLPISIHNRDSIGDCLKILKENREYLTHGGVIHCFSESVEVYKEIKKLGLKIAFGGILTFKNSKTAPLVCEVADIDDLLLETDCPYLAPTPLRGERNEPKYVSLVAQKIGEIKGLSYDFICEKTTENALKLFSKAR